MTLPAKGKLGAGRVLTILFLFTASLNVAVLLLTLGQPLADLHSFRQAQTAISVYWMLHGGPWLDYWTPVLGPPWSAPFEFPLFQWIVAALVKATGMPLDAAGRSVSWLWLIAGGLPAWQIARDLRLPRLSFPFFAILMLASPLYLFWGRAFMIETQALTLCLFFFLWGRRAIVDRAGGFALLAASAGLLAALTKITTCLPFFAALAVVALIELRRAGTVRKGAATCLCAALAMLPALVAFAAWNRHADALKAGNWIGTLLRSDAPRLVFWNFGSVGERLSSRMLEANLRALFDCFGLGAPALLLVVGILLARARPERRALGATAAFAALYALPWLVLTNLHIVHDYYQTANGLFALAAVAVALAAIAERGEQPIALFLCAALLASQLLRFATYQGAAIRALPAGGRDLAIARLLNRKTSPGDLTLIYGLDWSAFVPYYAERRARMEPSWTVPAEYRARLPAFGSISGSRVGAVVRCPSQLDGDAEALRSFSMLESESRRLRVGDCAIYLPRRGLSPSL
jgi:hypothetical protein